MDENRTKAAARNVEGKIEDVMGSVVEPIADRMSSLARQTSAAGEKAISVARDTAEKASAQAADVGGRLYDGSRRAGQTLGRTIGEQPLGSVLLAAAVGYGLAYLMHRRGGDR